MFVGWLSRRYAALQRKLVSMRKSAVKDQLYGGIIEMMHNRELFYRSDIGKNHEYSRWTDEGQQELMAFVLAHSKKMLVAHEIELDARAKELTFSALKKPEK